MQVASADADPDPVGVEDVTHAVGMLGIACYSRAAASRY
jgi:hypothetical protein